MLSSRKKNELQVELDNVIQKIKDGEIEEKEVISLNSKRDQLSRLGDGDAAKLALILSQYKLPKGVTVMLNRNDIGNEGGKALLNALRANPQSELTIHLNNNRAMNPVLREDIAGVLKDPDYQIQTNLRATEKKFGLFRGRKAKGQYTELQQVATPDFGPNP